MPDVMASRLNKQLPRYISWKSDPEAENMDAFTVSWANDYLYCFPSFSLVMRHLGRLKEDQREYLWTTQVWRVPLLELAIDYLRILPKSVSLLRIPGINKVHPLYKTLTLIACRKVKNQNILGKIIDIIMQSWQCSIQKQYASFIKRWLLFCCERRKDAFHTTLNEVLEFLTKLFESKLSYSALNTAHSALSAIGITIGGF